MEKDIVISSIYTPNADISTNHCHNGYQIIYVFNGEAELRIGSKTYDIQKHCIIFISNLELHSVTPIGEEYRSLSLLLSPKKIDNAIHNQTLLSVFSNRPPHFVHCIDVTAIHEKVEQIVLKLYEETKEESSYSDELSICLIKELLIELYRYDKKMFPNYDKGIVNVVWKVRCYIEENCTKDIKVNEIAELFYSNIYYLSHCFKTTTGYSIKQYILLCRLALAREFLYNSTSNVTEICFKAGFSDINNFIRYFKREVGVTPTEYRKNINR